MNAAALALLKYEKTKSLSMISVDQSLFQGEILNISEYLRWANRMQHHILFMMLFFLRDFASLML